MNSCLPVDSTVSLPGKPCAGVWRVAMSVTKGRGRGEQGMKGSERYSRDEKRRGQRSGRVYREKGRKYGAEMGISTRYNHSASETHTQRSESGT